MKTVALSELFIDQKKSTKFLRKINDTKQITIIFVPAKEERFFAFEICYNKRA